MLSVQGLAWRSDFMNAIRTFFRAHNYLEVDTPLRLPTLLPESQLIPFPSADWWLQTSPELCMKRLLARGCSHIFQICHCFRQEERGRLHSNEFTMLEWYRAPGCYTDLMIDCEELLLFLAETLAHLPGLCKEHILSWQGHTVNLNPPWKRMSVNEAFRHYAKISAEEALARHCFDEVLVTEIEPHLGFERPLFLYDYPLKLASLARKSVTNPNVAERFELYIAGIELANGFSELNDPLEQRKRFLHEIAQINSAGRESLMPELFLEDLTQMPPCAGIALGIDRLFMLSTEKKNIAEAVTFPISAL